VATPHDALFKRVFSQPHHAAGELRHVLPRAVSAQIDWKTLRLVSGSVVDPQHRDRHADLLYSVKAAGQNAFLYVLFEHKSGPNALTSFQLLVYVVRIWERFLEQKPHPKTLPAIIPIVVHHSDRGWTCGTNVRDLIDIPPNLHDALSPLLPSFPFLLDDLASESSDKLRERAMTEMAKLTLFCLKRARHSGDLLGELRLWVDTVRSLFAAADGAAALRSVFLYISQATDLPEDEVRNFLTVEIGPESEQLLKTTYDRLLERGRAEGRAEGGAAILLKLLTERFGALPADVEERVRTASVEQLDLWAVAVLKAKTLEEIFTTT
jgi:hypothetical protein